MTPQTPVQSTTNSSEFLTILQHVGMVLEILLPLAQASAAPFLKNPHSQAIAAAEAPIISAGAQTLASMVSK